MRTVFLFSLAFVLMTGSAFAQNQPTVLHPDLLGLLPATVQKQIESGHMTIVTSSYTATDPAANSNVASVTGAAGDTLYLLFSRCGGTVQGYFDVYVDNARSYRSSFFGDYGDSGYVAYPSWKSITASGATSLALRNPVQLTGTYSAEVIVGKVK